jgi:phosphodiesterase/alkaline phosphatase D-like protein
VSFGNLAQIHVLDTRQYRSAGAPAGCTAAERVNGFCPDALNGSRTIIGDKQGDWSFAL